MTLHGAFAVRLLSMSLRAVFRFGAASFESFAAHGASLPICAPVLSPGLAARPARRFLPEGSHGRERIRRSVTRQASVTALRVLSPEGQ